MPFLVTELQPVTTIQGLTDFLTHFMESHIAYHPTRELYTTEGVGMAHDHGIQWLYHISHYPEAAILISHLRVSSSRIQYTQYTETFI